MRITYDISANAVYIYLQPKEKHIRGIVKDRKGDYPINLDLMEDGKLFGIEILEANTMVDIENLKKIDFVEYK